MTRPEYSGERNLDFSKWVRQSLRGSSDGLAFNDLDGILDDFKRKRLMILETKTHNANSRYSQQCSHGLLDKALSLAQGVLGYDYWGYHVVKLSGTGPDNSTGITVDGKPVTASELVAFLNMDRWPSTVPRRRP